MPRKILKKEISSNQTRKFSRPRKSSDDSASLSEVNKALEAIENNRKQMLEMQNKILAAPAMNGGFSTLMYKIEKIEKSQEQIVDKVDEIRDVLYDPDSGIYARIKIIENESIDNEKFEKLEEDIFAIKTWKNSKEKSEEKEEQQDIDLQKVLSEHAEVIKELQSWYQKQAAVTKWLAVTVGTALIGGIGKIIHMFLSNHIQLIN